MRTNSIELNVEAGGAVVALISDAAFGVCPAIGTEAHGARGAAVGHEGKGDGRGTRKAGARGPGSPQFDEDDSIPDFLRRYGARGQGEIDIGAIPISRIGESARL